MSSNKQTRQTRQDIFSVFGVHSLDRALSHAQSFETRPFLSSLFSNPSPHRPVPSGLILSLSRALLPSAFHCSTCSTFFLTAYRRSLRSARCAPLFLLAALRAAMFARVLAFLPLLALFLFLFFRPSGSGYILIPKYASPIHFASFRSAEF